MVQHHLIDGKHPSILFGFQPSFWWCKVSSIHSSISTSLSLSLFRNLSAFSVSNQSLFAVSGSFWAYERPDVSWPCSNQRMDLGSFGGFLWDPNPPRRVLRPMVGDHLSEIPNMEKTRHSLRTMMLEYAHLHLSPNMAQFCRCAYSSSMVS